MKVSRIEERKKDKGKMDIELGAAVRLFRNMLSKRGERIKESELEQSALWARKKGQLQKASLMFSTTEWREIGDLLWSTVISGGKEGKIAQELGAVWGKVFRTLQFVSTEKKAATAAIQAFEGSVQEKPEPPSSRKPKTVKILSLCNRPICGLSASVSPTPQDVLDQVTKAEDLSPPPPTQTESETEVLQSLHSVGVKTGGDSGGAEGGDGQSQVTQSRGGTQGGMRGGDRNDVAQQVEPVYCQRARAHSDLEINVTSRRAAAPGNTAWFPSPTGGESASLCLATTARMATVARVAAMNEIPAQPRSPEPAQRPLPSDSDSDSEAVDNNQVSAFAARDRRQSQEQPQSVTASHNKQHSSELQQIISKLLKMFNRQEQQTFTSPQSISSAGMPPVSDVPMAAFSTNPIAECKAAAVRAAIMDGNWDAASALSCPVVNENNTARWQPYDWKILQKAKETVTNYGLRLAAALKDAPDLTEEVQDKLFRILAFDNTNSHTRTILATLPQGNPVDEMLVRATRAEQNSQNAAFMATMHDAIKQQGHILVAALTKGKSKNKSSSRNKPHNLTCFWCGESGHVKQSCQKPVWCQRCNTDSHATEACKKSGNSINSTLRHRAKTQVDALSQRTPVMDI
ncbi:hypothetical protein HGM15179_019714 [Zosterops borbonicus]|uniref:CCHC-type domain-containing protein n=1 Tax=Zosterops borbonicus TaxID=364589 RepID=A0A8K1D7M7_9PASS|nr:hypothetical protein HGM15179_019714 [Zosterops borbonicus]